jgi:hypothetical protein
MFNSDIKARFAKAVHYLRGIKLFGRSKSEPEIDVIQPLLEDLTAG